MRAWPWIVMAYVVMASMTTFQCAAPAELSVIVVWAAFQCAAPAELSGRGIGFKTIRTGPGRKVGEGDQARIELENQFFYGASS